MYRMRSYIRNQVCHLLIMPLRTCSGSPRAFGSRSPKRHGTDTTTTLLFPPREGGIMVQEGARAAIVQAVFFVCVQPHALHDAASHSAPAASHRGCRAAGSHPGLNLGRRVVQEQQPWTTIASQAPRQGAAAGTNRASLGAAKGQDAHLNRCGSPAPSHRAHARVHPALTVGRRPLLPRVSST